MLVPMVHPLSATATGSGALAEDCRRDRWSFGLGSGFRRREEDYRGTGSCDVGLCWEYFRSVGLRNMDPFQKGHQSVGPGTVEL
jgi:hypothetical protein